jgi:translocator protein
MRRFHFLLATIVVLGVNAAANALPFAGVTTGEVSARYPSGFTPMGFAFAIWSVIYIGLIAVSVVAIRAPEPSRARLQRVRTPFLVSCGANASWLVAWHYEQMLASFALIAVLLASLGAVNVRLRRYPATSRVERLCVDVPFSLYLGWVTTATLINLAIVLSALDAFPFGLTRDTWALATVVVAAVIYAAWGTFTRDPVFTAVASWATLAIAMNPVDVSSPVRVAAAATCASSATLALVLALRRPHNSCLGATPPAEGCDPP